MRKNPAPKEAHPLRGKTVLVTRARAQADALSRLLRKEGARVFELPVIEFAPPRSWQPLRRALRRLGEYDWLILTSANGVNALFEQMRKLRIAPAALSSLKIAVIGPATRQALRREGVRAALMPEEYVAEAAAAALAGRVRGKRVLVVRAAVARAVLPQALRRAGARVTVVAAYQTRIPAGSPTRLSRLLADHGAPDLVTCTSSSTVRNFLRIARAFRSLDRIAFASIGPVTSAGLREHGIEPAVEARRYTMPGLAEAICKLKA